MKTRTPSFSEQVKTARETRGLTQEELARLLSVTVATVSKWERGLHYPSPRQLDRVAYYLGIELA